MTANDDAAIKELAGVIRAHARYRAYQRRWRVGDRCLGLDWAEAYTRRMRLLERRRRRYKPPQLTPIGNFFDLLERVN